MKKLSLGILGCGDYLRWQAPTFQSSQRVTIDALYDPASERAEKWAQKLGGRAVPSAGAILQDPSIDAVVLYVPPHHRRELALEAIRQGKHFIATKPFASTVEDCESIRAAMPAGLVGAVQYNRTGNATVAALYNLFRSGEIGRLALYKQDWLHHYPQWNDWALDPENNGGPFMDAMIHNLNIANHLMGRPVESSHAYSSRLAHPDLPCADTQSLQLTYAGGGTAVLFITWAADLAVYSKEGNDREHLDFLYLITDRGWYVTVEQDDGSPIIRATREGEVRTWPVEDFLESPFDRFARAALGEEALPADWVGLEEATSDIALVRRFGTDQK